MRLSSKGLDLIKAQEGYLTKQADGGCKSYLCPAGKWTCGWGSTVGVGPLTQWTRDEAEEHLRDEMKKHEADVERLVKVPLTQGQFDALVSLSYNIGSGALERSTLMKHLNSGDYARAASHFGDFKKARVQGLTAKRMKVSDGTLVVLPGLVTRRAAEAQLFLEAEPIDMAQNVAAPDTKMKPREALMKVGAPVLAVAEGVRQAAPYIPSIPPHVSESIANLGAWKGLLAQLGSMGSEAYVAGGSGLTVAAGAYLAARKWLVKA